MAWRGSIVGTRTIINGRQNQNLITLTNEVFTLFDWICLAQKSAFDVCRMRITRFNCGSALNIPTRIVVTKLEMTEYVYYAFAFLFLCVCFFFDHFEFPYNSSFLTDDNR